MKQSARGSDRGEYNYNVWKTLGQVRGWEGFGEIWAGAGKWDYIGQATWSSWTSWALSMLYGWFSDCLTVQAIDKDTINKCISICGLVLSKLARSKGCYGGSQQPQVGHGGIGGSRHGCCYSQDRCPMIE